MRRLPALDPTDDAEAIRQVRAGRSAEYETLFRRHSGDLHRRALSRVHDAHLAEDMVQEAFLRSFRNLSQLKEPTRYLQWMHRILDNLCRMHYRRVGSRPSVVPLPAGDSPLMIDLATESPETLIARNQIRQVVREVCICLPLALRATALLYYVAGQSCEQISQVLSIPPETVDSRLYKARAWIRRLIVGNGRTLSQTALADRLVSLAQEVYIMDTVRIEISEDLIPLIRSDDRDTNMLQLIGHLRQELELDHSVHVPKVHVIDNLGLAPKSFSIFVREQRVSDGTIDDITDLTAFSKRLKQTILDFRDGLATNG